MRIRALRELGLGLDEIGVLVAADAAADTFPDVLTSLRTDLKRRAAALTAMAESVEQLLTGSGAASAELPWRDLVDAQGTPCSPSSGPGGPEQQRLAALLDSAEVGAALERLEPRLRALRDAPVSSPDVDPLAQELAAALPADLLPVAIADTAMLMVLLGRRFSAAQLRCVLAAGRIGHDTRPDAGGPR